MSRAFVFNAPKSVICRPGAVRDLGELALNTIGRHLLLVTDKGIVNAGLLEPVAAALDSAGIQFDVFSDVVADPPATVVHQAVEAAERLGIDGVIGLGGGSSMDVAKLVALLAKGEECLDDIYGVGMVKGGRLPLIQIPTTAGTGSEVTPISIITVGETEKKGVVSPCLLPDVALLDAELTLGLPPHVTATTGVDAMVHAIEAYTSASPNHNPVSCVLARQALSLLGANIRQAVHDGTDIHVRSDMLLGSMLAGQAFANSPVAAVHALAYPLGGVYHLSHGLTNALVLPHVMRFNQSACQDAYADLAPLVFPTLAEVADPAARCETFIAMLDELNRDLGLDTQLRHYRIPQSDLPMLASEAMKQTRLLVNNPREVSEADALTIYEAAW